MNFKQMTALETIASGTVADGYNRHRQRVTWHFDPASGNTLRHHKRGFHVDAIPPCSTIEEARWHLNHHPNARSYRIDS